MNLGKLLNKAVNAVKKNPEVALAVAGIIAPKLVTKAASKVIPIVVAVKAARTPEAS